MSNNLFVFNINGSPGNKVGIDSLSWRESDLSGNTPFVVSSLSDKTGYSNISSIENWHKHGESADLMYHNIRREIKSLYESDGVDWSGYTTSQKEILSSYFLVEKNKRDEVHSQEEQDEYDYFKIYNFISNDVYNRHGNVNSKITPKSIDYKREVSQRFNPKYEFDIKGFLTGVTYYEDLEVSEVSGISIYNFINPILRYEAEYFINSDLYVTHRTVNRKWQLMSDQWSDDIKSSTKIYDTKQSREEGNRRRKNLINNLLIDTVGLIFMTSVDLTTVSETESDTIPLLTEIDTGIKLYYESGAKRDSEGNQCLLMQQISGSTYNRLDNEVPDSGGMTIRGYVLYRLDP